jgi:2-haloacid dehalogenase
MTREISALVFDAYGTLFDVHSVATLAESLFPGKGSALSHSWRTKQLEYTWLRSLMGQYEDFGRVTTASLEWALAAHRVVAGEGAKAALVDEYRRLAMFPEVDAALRKLSTARPLAILSNGEPAMLEAVVDHNGIRDLFRGGILSVHAAGIFKPHPSVYRLAEEKLGVPAPLTGFVSSNGWDAAGAKAFGFHAYWINRAHAPAEQLGFPPDAALTDLAELARLLG